ncbi:MAG: trehalose-6-phosphate synthase [Elusimicrobia bacterium]|nr:trehalose-6-phosphate synthase [Elusimicrobiota bacterium]
MKMTVQFIISMLVSVFLVAAGSAYLLMRQERSRQTEELDRRSSLVAEGLEESVGSALAKGDAKSLERIVRRFEGRVRLTGIVVFDAKDKALAGTSALLKILPEKPELVAEAMDTRLERGEYVHWRGKPEYAFAFPIVTEEQTAGALLIVHDATYIRGYLARIWRHSFGRALVQMTLITLIILGLMRWSVLGPIRQMAEWMKKLRAGETVGNPPLPHSELFAPLAKEASRFARHLVQAKTAAEEEARLRQTAESLWTAERLKEHVKLKLNGKPLIVVSNREPYMHSREGRNVKWIVPAGGLVTALDPVMRAAGGTWVAHGAGDADWETVDESNRLRVPPDDPFYTLRRVAITKEEENGYYYGFANEGLWPLCHIAHTRPLFRAQDFAAYQAVNEKFARAVLEEIKGIDNPCVLIQDYHFALLPKILKAKRPDARVAVFWHIPWPNPEAFGICPWQKDLLAGMLGADLVSFHTQFHCNNFMETVDRVLECRIEWERFTVNRENHSTLVKPFPISVDFPEDLGPGPDRAALLKELGIKTRFLAVGVERMDYTKGVLERLHGIERFFEKFPEFLGELTYVQLGAPSRTHIKRYHDFLAEVDAEAERINWKYKKRDWRPIVFLKRHHNHSEILPFYRSADVCLVTSLHDGMNLVAKEFVAARPDNAGVLILSPFAGAARELRDALLVNPYDTERMADALRVALEMPADEQADRMKRMREMVREHNIYRWAGELIEELTRVRLPTESATLRTL